VGANSIYVVEEDDPSVSNVGDGLKGGGGG